MAKNINCEVDALIVKLCRINLFDGLTSTHLKYTIVVAFFEIRSFGCEGPENLVSDI